VRSPVLSSWGAETLPRREDRGRGAAVSAGACVRCNGKGEMEMLTGGPGLSATRKKGVGRSNGRRLGWAGPRPKRTSAGEGRVGKPSGLRELGQRAEMEGGRRRNRISFTFSKLIFQIQFQLICKSFWHLNKTIHHEKNKMQQHECIKELITL
jgi:hypothetical protein